jgi:hypothetical protein
MCGRFFDLPSPGAVVPLLFKQNVAEMLNKLDWIGLQRVVAFTVC